MWRRPAGVVTACFRAFVPPLGSPVSAEFAAIAVRAAASAQVFVEDVAQPVLSADDHHHVARVLRLRAGEEVVVSDGAGHWARALWQGGDTGSAVPAR